MHLHFANSLLSNFSRQVYVSKRWWGDLWERIMLASFCQNFYTFYMNFADNFMRAYNVGIISCKIYIFTYFTDKFMFVCGDLLRRIMVEWFCAIACNCSRSLPALYGFHTMPANFFVRLKFFCLVRRILDRNSLTLHSQPGAFLLTFNCLPVFSITILPLLGVHTNTIKSNSKL